VRATLGAGLLLATSMLVGVPATPAEAASVCDDGLADTAWRGPATEGGSVSWAETSNWTNGVPTATSVVCIPGSVPGPHVYETDAAADVIDARDATVTLSGTLTVGTSFDVAGLVGQGGELTGPGATTVTGSISGSLLRLLHYAVVELSQGAVVDADVDAWAGSWLIVRGEAVLGDGATIDSLGGRPFTITETGSLTLDGADADASIEGGFANHGEVTLAASQWLLMLGTSPEHRHPDEFSTGNFTGAAGTWFRLIGTELRTGARLDQVQFAGAITVPAGNTATAAASTLVGSTASDPEPTLSGAGELLVTDGTIVNARIGDSLTVTVPKNETAEVDGAIAEDQVHMQVFGELINTRLLLEDASLLEVHGVHRAAGPSGLFFEGTDPGLEIIRPEGQLLVDQDAYMESDAPILNEGAIVSSGRLALGGTTTLANGSSITGDVRVLEKARLRADLGPTGTASVSGVEVQGTVRVSSGTLDVVAPGPPSTAGVLLSGGRYVAAHGATLNLPPTTETLAATLRLMDEGSSVGGLAGLQSIAPTGELELLRGADLATSGGLENRGHVSLSSGSDLDVGGRFAQGPDARLTTRLSADGRGQVVASGRLDLAGDMMLDRDAGYRPAVGTTMWLLKGSTRRETKFARVLGRDPYANRRCVADYSQPDQVRLRVEGLS
jgi:hypothetical protein